MERSAEKYYCCPFCETTYRIAGVAPGETVTCPICQQEVVLPRPREPGPMSAFFSRHLSVPSAKLAGIVSLPFAYAWRAVRRTVDKILPENPAVDRPDADESPMAGRVGSVVRPMAPLMLSLAIHAIMAGVAATILIVVYVYEEVVEINLNIQPGQVMDLVYEDPRERNSSAAAKAMETPIGEYLRSAGGAPAESGLEEEMKEDLRLESRRTEERQEDSEDADAVYRRSFWVEPTPAAASSAFRQEKVLGETVRKIMARVREVEEYYERKIDRTLGEMETVELPPAPVRRRPKSDSQTASEYLMRAGRVKHCPASRIISTLLSTPDVTDDFIRSLIDEQQREGGSALDEKTWRKVIEEARKKLLDPDDLKKAEEEYRAAVAAFDRVKRELERDGDKRKERAAVFRKTLDELTKMLVEDVQLSRGTVNYIIFRALEGIDEPAEFMKAIDSDDFEIDIRSVQMRCEGRVLSEADVHSVREAVKLKWKELHHRLGIPLPEKPDGGAPPPDKE